MFAAVLAFRGYPGGLPKFFLGIALVIFVLAIVPGDAHGTYGVHRIWRGQKCEIIVGDDA